MLTILLHQYLINLGSLFPLLIQILGILLPVLIIFVVFFYESKNKKINIMLLSKYLKI